MTIISHNGKVDIGDSNNSGSRIIDSSSTNGTGGNIFISAAGDVSTDFSRPNVSSGLSGGGSVEITSTNGGVRVGVDSSSFDGNGGDIKITAGGGSFANLSSTSVETNNSNLNSNSTNGTGGNVVVSGTRNVRTRSVVSSGSSGGGSVEITSQSGEISVPLVRLFVNTSGKRRQDCCERIELCIHG